MFPWLYKHVLICNLYLQSLSRLPGEGNGTPLQYSSLENPMDRGAWWPIVHRVAKSQTRLKLLSTHVHICMCTTDSLCCTPETNTTLWINYTLIKIKETKQNQTKHVFWELGFLSNMQVDPSGDSKGSGQLRPRPRPGPTFPSALMHSLSAAGSRQSPP